MSFEPTVKRQSNNRPLDKLRIQLQLVKPLDVARSYIRCELGNIVDFPAGSKIKTFDAVALTWRLLEALSFTYRANFVFDTISNIGCDWYAADIPIEHLKMTGVNETVNKVIFAPDIDQNPLKFAAYLQRYFAANKHADPECLQEFQPRVIPETTERLIAIERAAKIEVIDGTHRLAAFAMYRRQTVPVYVARKNRRRQRHMLGDALFLRLRILYQNAKTDDGRFAVLSTAWQCMKQSSDGRAAIKKYWLSQDTKPVAQQAALELLNRKDIKKKDRNR